MDADGLRRLAGQWRVPLGVVEKDHAITVILGVVAGLPCVSQLAFKGGTALRKVHFLDYRFSEDLDSTALADVADDLAAAEAELQSAGRRSAVDVVGVSEVPGPQKRAISAAKYFVPWAKSSRRMCSLGAWYPLASQLTPGPRMAGTPTVSLKKATAEAPRDQGQTSGG